MAETTNTRDERKDEPERRGAPVGGAPAVADDGDVAFGGMVGVAIVSAIIISMLALGGFFDFDTGGSSAAPETTEAETTTTEAEPEETTTTEAEPEETTTTEAAAPETNTVVDISRDSGSLSTFVGVIEASGAAEVLEGPGPFTVFAPSDEALADLPDAITGDPEVLDRVLAYHVVSGTVTAADLVDGPVETVDGTDVNIANTATGAPTVNGASVLEADLTADNGVVHIIDTVLVPADIQAQLGGSLNQALGLAPINFEVNSAVITADSTATLDEAAEFLIATEAVVEIAGHTDSDGDDAFNQQLSQDRADAVLAYLENAGVPAENMTAVGYGESQPVAENDTPENKALNRRIEFVSAGN